MSRQFTVINESFDCDYCGRHVPQAKGTCRDHCPFCLSSKHVDHNPGDRANPCHGQLVATDYDLSPKKGLMLRFVCRRCHQEVRNKALREGEAPDDYDKILCLSRTR